MENNNLKTDDKKKKLPQENKKVDKLKALNQQLRATEQQLFSVRKSPRKLFYD
jgi:hypothetical protein